MSEKKLIEEELLEGLIAYTAHADELSDIDTEEWTKMLNQAKWCCIKHIIN